VSSVEASICSEPGQEVSSRSSIPALYPILCEHIEDGASLKAATTNELWAVAEPNQYPEDAYETLNDYL